MRTKQQNFFLIIILGLLNALTPFSIDMYLPAFPQMAKDLHSTIEQVAFSVSSYFIGYALGQIFYGPLLDHFGRKRPIYAGLSIYIAASIGCLLSTSIEALLIFRFLQAIGGCVASVAATTMVRDFFHVKEAAKIFSLLMLVLSVSPLLAPTIGGFVVTYWGWQVVFFILAGIAILNGLLVMFFLPNGYTPSQDSKLEINVIFNNFKTVLREPNFYIYTFAGSFSFAGLFVYIAGSPAIFMDGFHVSAQVYGGIFAMLSVGMIGGSQLNLLLTKKFSNKIIFKTAITVQVIVGFLFFLGSLNAGLSLTTTLLFLFVLLSCTGLTYPNAASIALSSFTQNIGSASALLGFIQLSVGSIASAFVGLLHLKGTLPTAAVMSVCSLTGYIILMVTTRYQRKIQDLA